MKEKSMRIFIDIGHPAHVHYFRNLIFLLKEHKHEILITARDKEVSHELLSHYDIAYINRGRGRKSLIGKLLYLLHADIKLLRIAKSWKPDIMLSFGSPYAAHVAKYIKKPHIALTDTENAKLGIWSFAPFSEIIITPEVFLKSFGKKHIRINAYFELCYLHPKYYEPDISIRKTLGIDENERFVLLRFISWMASHDLGQKGISDELKVKLVKLFSDRGYKVFISSEGRILKDLEKYKLDIPAERIHDILSEADMFIGESGTMATEAALLGTPSCYVNSLDAGVFQDEVKKGLLHSFRNDKNILPFVEELLSNSDLKAKHLKRVKQFISEKIDVTAFLVWFIENYPESFNIMKANPDYQYNFK